MAQLNIKNESTIHFLLSDHWVPIDRNITNIWNKKSRMQNKNMYKLQMYNKFIKISMFAVLYYKHCNVLTLSFIKKVSTSELKCIFAINWEFTILISLYLV